MEDENIITDTTMALVDTTNELQSKRNKLLQIVLLANPWSQLTGCMESPN